jgi:hypothetical protein
MPKAKYLNIILLKGSILPGPSQDGKIVLKNAKN